METNTIDYDVMIDKIIETLNTVCKIENPCCYTAAVVRLQGIGYGFEYIYIDVNALGDYKLANLKSFESLQYPIKCEIIRKTNPNTGNDCYGLEFSRSVKWMF